MTLLVRDRLVQELAIENPECADDETRDLMQFIQEGAHTPCCVVFFL